MFAKHLALGALLALAAACSSKPTLDCAKTCSTVADCDLNFACEERVCVPESGGFSVASCPGHATPSSSATSTSSTSGTSSTSSASATATSSGSTGRAVCSVCLTATDCESSFCPDDGTRPLYCQPRLCHTANSCNGHDCLADGPLANRCRCAPTGSTGTSGSGNSGSGSSGSSTGSTGSSGSQGATGTGSTGL